MRRPGAVDMSPSQAGIGRDECIQANWLRQACFPSQPKHLQPRRQAFTRMRRSRSSPRPLRRTGPKGVTMFERVVVAIDGSDAASQALVVAFDTDVCRAGQSALSQCEIATGPGFSSPNQPGQERTTAYRVISGPDFRLDAHWATIVGDWEEPSEESWISIVVKARR